jgi:hypothetical protein
LSIHEIPDFPAFDMFCGKVAPYHGFGGVIHDAGEFERQLHAEAAQVRMDVQKTFRAKLNSYASIPKELDGLIEKMWEIGLLLFEATLDVLGGKPIFRPPGKGNVYVHNSIFWPGVEAFPFHKAFKCLTESDGESMAYFVRGVGLELERKGLLTPEMKARLPKAD